MRFSRRLIDFNKQILFGEIGALVGTPLAPLVVSHITADPTLLSLAAVFGGLVSGSGFWLVVKVRDEGRNGTSSVRALAGQIAYFTPAAFVAGLIVYQPTLFFVARHLLARGDRPALSALVAQGAAFGLFLLVINLYRTALQRIVGRQL